MTAADTREIDSAEVPPPPHKALLKWLWPIELLLALGFVGVGAHLVEELTEGERFRWDAAILLALRTPGDLARPIGPIWLKQSMIDLSALGGFTLVWLLCSFAVGFLAYVGRRAESAWLAFSVVGASTINALMKLVLHRPRPHVVPHLAEVSNASFPSGHAMIATAVYLTVAVMLAEAQTNRGPRAFVVGFACVLVLLIGFSRLYLGVHWPSDVLGGWCFGGVWTLLVFAANRALRRRHAGRPALRE